MQQRAGGRRWIGCAQSTKRTGRLQKTAAVSKLCGTRSSRLEKKDMEKATCLLCTVFIAVVVFCHSGDALRCYTCEQSPVVCRTNVTCTHEEDVCLQIRFLHLRTYSCWKSSRCTRKEVADEFDADSFRFLCCYRDLCNRSPSLLAVSAAAFSISAATVLWMVSQ